MNTAKGESATMYGQNESRRIVVSRTSFNQNVKRVECDGRSNEWHRSFVAIIRISHNENLKEIIIL